MSYKTRHGVITTSRAVNTMRDAIFVGVLIGFFLLGAVFVKVCDSIIGSDEEVLAEGATEGPQPEGSDERLAA
jgi:hypothetical protein